MVMAASFIVGIAVQPWVNTEAIPMSVTLLAICTMFWLFTSMQERTSHNAVSLGSALALVVALVSIISTSKNHRFSFFDNDIRTICTTGNLLCLLDLPHSLSV